MSIEIKGVVYRNIQEQVQKNKDDIEALSLSKADAATTYNKTAVDELLYEKVDKEDFGYIYLEEASGTLTDEQFAECLKEYAVIDYKTNDNIITRYYKLSESDYPLISSGSIHFNRCWFGSNEDRTDTQGRAYKRALQYIITVNRYTKAYSVASEGLYDFYGKTNIDTLLANLPTEGVGSLTVTGVDGTLSDDDYNTINDNDISVIIKDGLSYYKYEVDSTKLYFRTIPYMTYLSDTKINYFGQRTITVTKSTKGWSDANTSYSMPVVDKVYKYQVNLEFAKTGTGAGNYSVYFTVESTTNYGSAMTFAQLRDVIHANGDRVQCVTQSAAGTLDFVVAMQSVNADLPTILIDSKTLDYFEFYSFSDLTSYSITPLEY